MSEKTIQISALVVSVAILAIMAYGFFQDRKVEESPVTE